MRKSRRAIVLLALTCGVLALGCAGDVGKQVMGSPELQGRIMDMIAANPATAGAMTDRLLASDSTRTELIARLVANAGGAQGVMAAVAKDPTLLDGALNLAMQDAAMKQHVLTLFKGMQMAGAK